MKVHKLIINNFMPYKGKQEIEFPQHETQNVMLLFGDNMRGKTSFLNAIRWGFYGIALARHMREIPRSHLINSEAADEGDWSMSISILFEHEGRNYELNRSIEKRDNVTQPKNNSDFSEVIGLRINGTPVIGDSINNEINQVMPKEVSRFFLFDGELLQEYENLLIEESDQGKKIKEHIESVLGVPALIHARDELQVLLKDARSMQRRDAQKNDELRKYAQDQKGHEVKLKSLEDDIGELDRQRLGLQERVDEIDDFLKNTEAVQNKKLELTRLDTEKKGFEFDIKKSNNTIHALLKTAWKDVLESSVQSITHTLKLERKGHQKSMEEASALQGEITNLRKSIDENKECNTCGQEIPESKRQPLREKLELLEKQPGRNVDFSRLTELNKNIDNLESIRAEGEVNRIITNLETITKIKVKLMGVENQCDDIEEEIKGFDTDEIMRKREKRERYGGQLAKTSLDKKDREEKKEENLKKQEKISQLMAKHKGSEGKLSNLRVERLQQLETVFAEGINQLRLKLKGDVESHATSAFKQLTTEKTYTGLSINQNYGLSILDQNKKVIDERSAGAEQVVALSLIDGLNKTSGTKAPIVMDTPLGRLDPKHRKNILQYLPDMSEQVVLLVHEGEIHAKRDTEIFASRIGARYEIKRISATQSRIERV